MSSIVDASVSSLQSLPGDLQASLQAVKELDDVIQVYSKEMDKIVASISIHSSKSSKNGDSKNISNSDNMSSLFHLKEILEYLYELKLQIIVNLYDSTECGFKIVSTQIKGIESGQFQKEMESHSANGTLAELLQQQTNRNNSASSSGAAAEKSNSSKNNRDDSNRKKSRNEGISLDKKKTGDGVPGDHGGNEHHILDSIETVQPNEPVYCICNQYAYGDMIACDNEDCLIEWFHMYCVKLTKYPKNSWLCPRCS